MCIAYDPAITLWSISPREILAHVHKELWIRIFIPVLFLRASSKQWNTGNILSVHQFKKWLTKSWSIHTMENYEAGKENEVVL